MPDWLGQPAPFGRHYDLGRAGQRRHGPYATAGASETWHGAEMPRICSQSGAAKDASLVRQQGLPRRAGGGI